MATTEWPAERVRKTFVEYFEKQCDHVNYVSSPVGEQLGRGGAARRDAGGGGGASGAVQPAAPLPSTPAAAVTDVSRLQPPAPPRPRPRSPP